VAVHPPSTLLNLSALDDPAVTSVTLIAVDYHANLLTAADGRMTFVFCCVTSCYRYIHHEVEKRN